GPDLLQLARHLRACVAPFDEHDEFAPDVIALVGEVGVLELRLGPSGVQGEFRQVIAIAIADGLVLVLAAEVDDPFAERIGAANGRGQQQTADDELHSHSALLSAPTEKNTRARGVCQRSGRESRTPTDPASKTRPGLYYRRRSG